MNTNTILTLKKYSEKFKKNIVSMYLRGRNGKRLRDKYRIPKSTFYYWIEKYKKIYSKDGVIIMKHDYKKLQWENARMQKQLEAYQITGCSPQSTDKDKLVAIDKYRSLYPIKYLCDVLNINRTKFYRYIAHEETKTERRTQKLTSMIKEIAANNPCYDSKRICQELKRQSYITSYKTLSSNNSCTKISFDLSLFL